MILSLVPLYHNHIISVSYGIYSKTENKNQEIAISQWIISLSVTIGIYSKVKTLERRLCKVVNHGRQFIAGPKGGGLIY